MDDTNIKQIIDESFNNQYEYLKFLGEGAFARVYLLKHNFLEEKRAIKIVKQPLSHSNNVQKVFHEVRVATQLRNKNIISIYDAGIIRFNAIDEHDIIKEDKAENEKKWAYFILEYVNGGDLEDYRKSFVNSNMQMPIYLILNIIKQITIGLNTLHSSNPTIIHRDLKTQNILLTYDNRGEILIKLSDFGFATELTTSRDDIDVGGTKPYMAPECFDKEFSTQTDIYALGVIFYLLLTDHFPYDVGQYATKDLITKQAWKNKLIPPSKYNRQIPEYIEKVVLKSLEVQVEKRYQDAQDFLEDINLCIGKHESEAVKETADEKENYSNIEHTNDNIKEALNLAKQENKLNDAIEILEKEVLKDYSIRKTYSKRLRMWKSDNPDIKLIMEAFRITLRGKKYNLACELLDESFAYNSENKNEYEGYYLLWKIFDKLEKDGNLFEAVGLLEQLTKTNDKINNEYASLLNVLKTYQVKNILNESLRLKQEGNLTDAAKLLEFVVVSDKRIAKKYSYKLSLWKQNLQF